MIGGDFDVPIMYQDLGNSTMSPMNIPFGMMPGMYGVGMYGVGMYGGGMANTSYLGGVQMRQQPDRDKVEILNKKENSDKNTFKKARMVLGGLILLGSIAPLRKSIKKAGGIGSYLKNMFTSKSGKGNWFTKMFHRKNKTSP